MIGHDGDMAPWVLHVDMDQFIAAVEVLRHPELAGLARHRRAVAGDPTERGVVSTASYEARAFGVRSGMPLRTAVRRCPDAVVLAVDKPAYDAASAVVMDAVRAVPGVVVEVLGWDEAFVGVTADDPEAVARRIQADVLAASRLHCTVGVGDTKVRAKIATEFGKPRGTFRLTRDNWFEVMGEKPTGRRSGASGRASRNGWPGWGCRPCDSWPRPMTACWQRSSDRRPGRGSRSSGAARAPRSSTTPRGWPRAHGRETTYQRDLEPAEVEAAMRVLAEQVVDDIRVEERACARVHLKVRFRPFFTVNRSRKLAEPTWDPAVMADTAFDALPRARRRPAGAAAGCPRRDGATRGWVRAAAHPRPPRQPLTAAHPVCRTLVG